MLAFTAQLLFPLKMWSFSTNNNMVGIWMTLTIMSALWSLMLVSYNLLHTVTYRKVSQHLSGVQGFHICWSLRQLKNPNMPLNMNIAAVAQRKSILEQSNSKKGPLLGCKTWIKMIKNLQERGRMELPQWNALSLNVFQTSAWTIPTIPDIIPHRHTDSTQHFHYRKLRE